MSARLLIAAVVIVTAGCVRTVQTVVVDETPMAVRPSEPVRGATNLPQRLIAASEARVPGDCPPTLRDPGMGASLSLVHSLMLPVQDSVAGSAYHAFGNYAVSPRGAYGDVEGEALRVDCRTLRPIGIVRLGGLP